MEDSPLTKYIKAIIAAVLLALLIRYSLLESIRIPTAVMIPTIKEGDFVLARKWVYGIKIPGFQKEIWRGRPPRYGEIVTYIPKRLANEQTLSGNIELIKRVIALPGDKIQILKGRVVLNGRLLAFVPNPGNPECGVEYHPYATYEICLKPPLVPDWGPVRVPKKKVFVIADNRTAEVSRVDHQFTAITSLVGKVSWVWLSLEQPKLSTDQQTFPSLRLGRMFISVDAPNPKKK